jgi:hypothetical protein
LPPPASRCLVLGRPRLFPLVNRSRIGGVAVRWTLAATATFGAVSMGRPNAEREEGRRRWDAWTLSARKGGAGRTPEH